MCSLSGIGLFLVPHPGSGRLGLGLLGLSVGVAPGAVQPTKKLYLMQGRIPLCIKRLVESDLTTRYYFYYTNTRASAVNALLYLLRFSRNTELAPFLHPVVLTSLATLARALYRNSLTKNELSKLSLLTHSHQITL